MLTRSITEIQEVDECPTVWSQPNSKSSVHLVVVAGKLPVFCLHPCPRIISPRTVSSGITSQWGRTQWDSLQWIVSSGIVSSGVTSLVSPSLG